MEVLSLIRSALNLVYWLKANCPGLWNRLPRRTGKVLKASVWQKPLPISVNTSPGVPTRPGGKQMRRTECVARVTGGSGLGFYWDTESLQSSTDCLGTGCMPLKSKPKKINPIVITDCDRKGLNLGMCVFVCVCVFESAAFHGETQAPHSGFSATTSTAGHWEQRGT